MQLINMGKKKKFSHSTFNVQRAGLLASAGNISISVGSLRV